MDQKSAVSTRPQKWLKCQPVLPVNRVTHSWKGVTQLTLLGVSTVHCCQPCYFVNCVTCGFFVINVLNTLINCNKDDWGSLWIRGYYINMVNISEFSVFSGFSGFMWKKDPSFMVISHRIDMITLKIHKIQLVKQTTSKPLVSGPESFQENVLSNL